MIRFFYSITLALTIIVFPSLKKQPRFGYDLFTIHNSLFTPDTLLFPDEKHFKNVQQLTFGGDNAEAYWSYDGKYIIFQRTNPKEGLYCDQIFIGKVPQKPGDKFEYKMVSNGKGR